MTEERKILTRDEYAAGSSLYAEMGAAQAELWDKALELEEILGEGVSTINDLLESDFDSLLESLGIGVEDARGA